MKIVELALKVRDYLFLQSAPVSTSGNNKTVFSYDTTYSHKEGNKKFYTISYVHNRDIVPGVAVQHAKQIKRTIV